jgi:hypothetical protein
MKFKTSELIARIDTLIVERENAAEEKHVQAVADVEAARTTWLQDHGPAYLEFANRIKEKIRKDRPILLEDIPQAVRARYNEYAYFRPSSPPKKREAEYGELLTLKATLAAITDEHVTTTGLREIGFKNIADLFRTEKKAA